MMRHRQRPTWTQEQLKEIYAGPHNYHVLSPGHDLRIATTKAMCKRICPEPQSVADLSCGVPDVAVSTNASVQIFGDFAPGFPIHGPIEQTIDEIDPVDLFICAETLEHLDDPVFVLHKIRDKAKYLVCSVPICAVPEDDANGEHIWAFDREGAEEMLRETGWEPTFYEQVEAAPGSVMPTYQCGIWGCK